MTNEIYDESLRYWGLSTVPKPQNPAYYLYVEVDTGKQFAWDLASKTWQEYVPAGHAPGLDEVLVQAQGLISQNFDRQLGTINAIMTNQRAYYMLVPLRRGAVINSISIAVHTAGATMSLSKVGLYNADGDLLAASGDQGSAWESTGIKTADLSTPYEVPETGGYYVAILANGATAPTLVRGGGFPQGSGSVNGGLVPFAIQSSLSDLADPATMTVTTGTGAYWVGLS